MWTERAFLVEIFSKHHLYMNTYWLKMKEIFLALLCIQTASWKIQRLEAANITLWGKDCSKTSGLQFLIRITIGISIILHTVLGHFFSLRNTWQHDMKSNIKHFFFKWDTIYLGNNASLALILYCEEFSRTEILKIVICSNRICKDWSIRLVDVISGLVLWACCMFWGGAGVSLSTSDHLQAIKPVQNNQRGHYSLQDYQITSLVNNPAKTLSRIAKSTN